MTGFTLGQAALLGYTRQDDVLRKGPGPMIEFLTLFALPAVLLALLVSLGFGLFAMNRTGDEARERSGKMMGWRIGLHLAAFAIIILIMALR